MKKSLRNSVIAVGALTIVGCNAMNDNPIDSDKMQSIRQKQNQERQAFNPSMTTPKPGAQAGPATNP